MRKKLYKSELANLFQTSKETLRHYENIGLIKPKTNAKEYKLYGIEEINVLRQVFFLKELEVPLEDIHDYIYEEKDKDVYLTYMRSHLEKVEERMRRLSQIRKKINNLINVLESDQLVDTFSVETYPERHFYVLNFTTSEDGINPKSFYDQFKELIEEGRYSERNLMMLYPYAHLSNNLLDAKICIEIDSDDNDAKQLSSIEPAMLKAGHYLTVYYLFEHGDESMLTNIYNRVETYLAMLGMKVAGERVLEIEHPEFAMVCKENESVFELQIPITEKDKMDTT